MPIIVFILGSNITGYKNVDVLVQAPEFRKLGSSKFAKTTLMVRSCFKRSDNFPVIKALICDSQGCST